jgi:hypothetical protein
MKRFLIAAAAAAGLMMFPAAASASVCGDDGSTIKLFDSQGYFFDFSQSQTPTPDHNDPFGTLYDSGSNDSAGSPPGPVDNDDSYDDFGGLFVGGTDDGHMYFSADNNSCSDPAAGEHDYPVVPLAGLNVQRKIYVSPTGPLPGARILNLLSNPTKVPITTTVQVGDLTTTSNRDDLGSDGATEVRASSNGDTSASPADFWAVTNDDPDTTDDNTLAHVIDGHGALKANLFQVGGGTITSSAPEDNVIWGWTVTIPAHRTVGLMSFEVQQGVSDDSSPAEVANAAAAANAYETAPMPTIYQGMTPAEAATVANWPQPPVKCKKHKKKHGKKSAAAAKKHKKSTCKKHKKKHKK